MKKMIISVLALSLILGGCAKVNPEKQVSNEPIKIGVLAPLSGNAAVIGEKIKIGINRAVSEINSEKEILQIIYEDNKNDSKEAVSAVRRLLDINKVDLIITSMSGSSLSILPIAKEKNIPIIATVVYVDVPSKYDNAVQFFIKPEAEAQALLDVIDKLEIKKLGLLYLINDYGIAIKSQIENVLGEIIAEGYNMSDNTFKTQLLKLKASEVDTIYAITFPHTVGIMIKEMKELGFNGRFITNAPIYLNGLLETSDVFNGTYTAVPKNYMNTGKSIFFENKFGTKYPAGNAYIPYDVVKLLGEEFEKGVSVNDIVNVLVNKGTIKTSVNGDFYMNAISKSVDIPLSIVKIENNEFVAVE